MDDDELDPDDLSELDAELDGAELEAELEQEVNGRTLSIRRADGEEIVSIQSTSEEWSVHLLPGGAIRNAYIGSRGDSPVWVNAWEGVIERDDDGTYVIRVD